MYMLIYRFNRKGLDYVEKDVDKIIGQLKTLVKHQRKSMKSIQQACLQMKATGVDDMDISQFFLAAYHNFKKIVDVQYDISLLTKYRKIIEKYSELMESSCDTFDINMDKFVSTDRLSKEIKEKFFKTLDVHSCEKLEDFKKFCKECSKGGK